MRMDARAEAAQAISGDGEATEPMLPTDEVQDAVDGEEGSKERSTKLGRPKSGVKDNRPD